MAPTTRILLLSSLVFAVVSLQLVAPSYAELTSHHLVARMARLRGGGNAIVRLQMAMEKAAGEFEEAGLRSEIITEDMSEMRAKRSRAFMQASSPAPQSRDVPHTENVVEAENQIDFGSHPYDYDLIVIGGGSGGLACSKQAASYGAKVAVCDYVDPTPKGTSWGLGGTCVNVGCIPKKLMHRAGLIHDAMMDAKSFGFKCPDNVPHSWQELVDNVQNYIGSLNFGYRNELRSANVEYWNSKARFLDAHTVELQDSLGRVERKTAAAFVISVGGRPKYLDIEGDRECCVTSDDLFSLKEPPGRTLVVGASYVALECAGFLHAIGFSSTVMMRSIPLRGFDQECAELVVDYMKKDGVDIWRGCLPKKFEKVGKQVKVYYTDDQGEVKEDVFDTVLLAIGRYALTKQLDLDKAGVKVESKSQKIVGVGKGIGDTEQTTCEHIFAIGDVLDGRPELTPVAIQAGQLLADRLFGDSRRKMDYLGVPTTVFTPLEYGCVGMSEEEAMNKYGKDKIEVYHNLYRPLEWALPMMELEPRAARKTAACFLKVIVLPSEQERIVGMHIVGDNAGEIIQGFALAVKLRACKKDLDELVGIHPTSAESFTTLTVTKSSGKKLKLSGC